MQMPDALFVEIVFFEQTVARDRTVTKVGAVVAGTVVLEIVTVDNECTDFGCTKTVGGFQVIERNRFVGGRKYIGGAHVSMGVRTSAGSE